MGDITPTPKGIPRKYGKRTEEKICAPDANEERFVATGKKHNAWDLRL